MKVKFKVAVRVGSETFHKGIREVPESLRDHWYIKAHAKDGTIEILDEAPAKEADEKDDSESDDKPKGKKSGKKKAGAE